MINNISEKDIKIKIKIVGLIQGLERGAGACTDVAGVAVGALGEGHGRQDQERVHEEVDHHLGPGCVREVHTGRLGGQVDCHGHQPRSTTSTIKNDKDTKLASKYVLNKFQKFT